MLEQTIVIPNATAADIYDVLLNSLKHSEVTGDTAEIDARVDGQFSSFSGYAVGKITKLESNKLIEQTWRASDWPQNHFSTIAFELSDVEGGAQIHFTQTHLPKGTMKEFEQGWIDNYWEPLKSYFASE
jgi:activator of HSP90 ATPase